MSAIRIITRMSQLARWQAEYVMTHLQRHHPNKKFELIMSSTEGDDRKNQSLSEVGGKGLFIKRLEENLIANEADLAVHSLKDMPAILHSQFQLAAVLPRDAIADAFVSITSASLEQLPTGSKVGTASLRRTALLKHYYPHLEPVMLRGNLETRWRKLTENEFDAIILSAAGLERLGWQDRIRQRLDPKQFVPAPGQGVIVIEALSQRGDIAEIFQPLHDISTQRCIDIERSIAARMGASCSSAFGAWAEPDITDPSKVTLHVLVGSADGTQLIRSVYSGLFSESAELIERTAVNLEEQGARRLLEH